jgi:hypothetical protein
MAANADAVERSHLSECSMAQSAMHDATDRTGGRKPDRRGTGPGRPAATAPAVAIKAAGPGQTSIEPANVVPNEGPERGLRHAVHGPPADCDRDCRETTFTDPPRHRLPRDMQQCRDLGGCHRPLVRHVLRVGVGNGASSEALTGDHARNTRSTRNAVAPAVSAMESSTGMHDERAPDRPTASPDRPTPPMRLPGRTAGRVIGAGERSSVRRRDARQLTSSRRRSR